MAKRERRVKVVKNTTARPPRKSTINRERTVQANRELSIKHISPLTDNQRRVFEAYDNDQQLFLHGFAGTGKSFLAIYLSLSDILDHQCDYDKLYIVRTAEPSKNVGFLPGSLEEKTNVYEAPYVGLFNELLGRGDAYEVLKKKGVVEFITTSYIRGITLDNCIIIVDEIQNMEANELIAILTRLGTNSRIIMCGDYRQSDLKNNHKDSHRKEDILRFKEVVEKMESFSLIEFEVDDIIRSKIVKEFIIKATEMGFM